MPDVDLNFVTVSVTIEREMRVPVDIIGDLETDPDDLRFRAEDWFWNHWGEMLENEPGPRKSEISVDGVDLPDAVANQGGDA